MNNKKILKSFPRFNSDKEAEDFVENTDLSEYDFSDFKPSGFEFQKKDVQINMRLPHSQLKAIKTEAVKRNKSFSQS